jgi:hypothetical protein
VTDEKKDRMVAGVSVAALAAGLALWPQIREILVFLAGAAAYGLGKPSVHAVLVGTVIGTFAGFALPRWLPGRWAPATTRTVAGVTSALLAGSTVMVMVPTHLGAVYAMLALFASPTVAAAARQLWYWYKPAAKPESLQPPTPGETR